MKTLCLRLLALGAPLFSAATLPAAFNPAIVPSDSQWLLHADMAALRESGIGQELTAILTKAVAMENDSPVRPNFQKILTTVGTLTAFGKDLSGDPNKLDGVAILQGSPELRTIAEGLVAQLSLMEPTMLTELKDLPFEAYSVENQVVIALPGEPIVVVSKSREHLLSALEVFRGKGNSMARRPGRLAELTPKGGRYFLLAASIVPSSEGLFPTNSPQARILQMATAAAVAVGEDASRTLARVQLEASSNDIAEKLMRIVQGMIAVASLVETNDESLTEFINSVKIERQDRQVNLELSYPTDRLLQMIHGLTHEVAPRQQVRVNTPPAPPKVEGRVVAEWVADENLGGDAPTATNFATRTIEDVKLVPGAMIVVAGRMHDGEHARIDYLEISPAGAGADAKAERYEAEEFIRLENYEIEPVSFASGGQVIKNPGGAGSARLRYRGPAGTYVLKVRYVDEADGRAPLVVSVVDPVAVEATPAP